MRIKLRMVGSYGQFTAGEVVNPTKPLADQMIAAGVARPLVEDQQREADADPIVEPKKEKKASKKK